MAEAKTKDEQTPADNAPQTSVPITLPGQPVTDPATQHVAEDGTVVRDGEEESPEQLAGAALRAHILGPEPTDMEKVQKAAVAEARERGVSQGVRLAQLTVENEELRAMVLVLAQRAGNLVRVTAYDIGRAMAVAPEIAHESNGDIVVSAVPMPVA